MRPVRRWILALLVGVTVCQGAGPAEAAEWGRFFHYPYSYFPHNYRQPFRSRDYDTRFGYPMYPAYVAFPPYFRRDLVYPYHWHSRPGGDAKRHYLGMHFVLDVF